LKLKKADSAIERRVRQCEAIYPDSDASPQCKLSGCPLGEHLGPMGPGDSFFVQRSTRLESASGERTVEYKGEGQGGFSTGLEGAGRGGGGGVTGLDFSCSSDSAKVREKKGVLVAARVAEACQKRYLLRHHRENFQNSKCLQIPFYCH
jgi:hypothetical protein